MKNKTMRLNKTLIATAVVALLTAPAAHATLQFVGPVDLQGTGLGTVATLLTMQHKGNATTEDGSVFANGAGQDTSGTNVVAAQSHLL